MEELPGLLVSPLDVVSPGEGLPRLGLIFNLILFPAHRYFAFIDRLTNNGELVDTLPRI